MRILRLSLGVYLFFTGFAVAFQFHPVLSNILSTPELDPTTCLFTSLTLLVLLQLVP